MMNAVIKARAINSTRKPHKVLVDTRIDLYKACKWEVAIAFGDHGMNLSEMWKAVHEDSWWRKVCLEDYEKGRLD